MISKIAGESPCYFGYREPWKEASIR